MTQLKRSSGFFSWVVVLSELSHVFCCVLPSVFSLITIFAGMGFIGAMPIWLVSVHAIMHGWEIPLMIMSGSVLVIGWVLHFVSKSMDCHDSGCVHEPCEPRKKDTVRVLEIATLLFVVNIVIYLSVHLAF